MAITKELQDAMDKIDTATTAVGDKIVKLSEQITTDMSQSDVDDLVARLNAEADKLTAIGADPANPVPGELPPA